MTVIALVSRRRKEVSIAVVSKFLQGGKGYPQQNHSNCITIGNNMIFYLFIFWGRRGGDPLCMKTRSVLWLLTGLILPIGEACRSVCKLPRPSLRQHDPWSEGENPLLLMVPWLLQCSWGTHLWFMLFKRQQAISSSPDGLQIKSLGTARL